MIKKSKKQYKHPVTGETETKEERDKRLKSVDYPTKKR
tara:strand:+ start:2312 stop:2425 length:114 start_codon:yes stop_codon:yes gene_type:complete